MFLYYTHVAINPSLSHLKVFKTSQYILESRNVTLDIVKIIPRGCAKEVVPSLGIIYLSGG